jgi:hypothetical protein
LPHQNALKLAYGNVKINKMFRGLYHRTPLTGERRWRTGRKGGEGRPPRRQGMSEGRRGEKVRGIAPF